MLKLYQHGIRGYVNLGEGRRLKIILVLGYLQPFSGCYAYSGLRLNEHQADHITRKYDIVWGSSHWFPWKFPNPGSMLVLSLWCRDKETINAITTLLLIYSIECSRRFICKDFCALLWRRTCCSPSLLLHLAIICSATWRKTYLGAYVTVMVTSCLLWPTMENFFP